MRPTINLLRTAPLVAALALAACSNDDPDAVSDEQLSAEEVEGISDNGVMPQPGEYATELELVEFDAEGLDPDRLAEARQAFSEGAAEPQLFCVTEQTTREQWLSDMAEAECSLNRLTADGGEVEGAMTCSSDIGFNGRVELAGTAGEDGSDMRMTYNVPTDAGEGTLRMRVRTNRVGDCG